MGDAPRPGSLVGDAGLVIRIGMAEGHQHAGFGQAVDLSPGHVLGCDRHHQERQAPGGLDQQREVGIGHRPDQRRIMRALAGERQVRAFEVQPADPRHALCDRRRHRRDGGAAVLGRVGDEGGQDGAGAEPGMGRGHDRQRLGRGRVVEHHAAAAIDLEVDESGREDIAGEVDLLAGRRDPIVAVEHRHHAILEPQGVGVVEAAAVEDPAAAEGENPGAHRVSVTFLRWRGASGSIPRFAATCSTMP